LVCFYICNHLITTKPTTTATSKLYVPVFFMVGIGEREEKLEKKEKTWRQK